MKALAVLWYILRAVAGAFGIGVRLLDHRPVGEGVYDATRWLTFLYFPLLPLKTWRIRPRGAEITNLGAVVETQYSFELLGERATPASRIIRMFIFGWVMVPLVLAGPLAGALLFAKTQGGGAPSSLKTVLMLASAIWAVVVVGLLNHRREKLYD